MIFMVLRWIDPLQVFIDKNSYRALAVAGANPDREKATIFFRGIRHIAERHDRP